MCVCTYGTRAMTWGGEKSSSSTNIYRTLTFLRFSLNFFKNYSVTNNYSVVLILFSFTFF